MSEYIISNSYVHNSTTFIKLTLDNDANMITATMKTTVIILSSLWAEIDVAKANRANDIFCTRKLCSGYAISDPSTKLVVRHEPNTLRSYEMKICHMSRTITTC